MEVLVLRPSERAVGLCVCSGVFSLSLVKVWRSGFTFLFVCFSAELRQRTRCVVQEMQDVWTLGNGDLM